MIIAAAVCIMGAGMASSEPTEQWNKTFGGTFTELGFSVQQTSDGGYILVGYTTSYGAGGFDVYLVKTDSTGNMQWNKTFGGLFRDMGMSVQQTLDGGYIIAGLKDLKNDGIGDALLIKTDLNGVQEWNRTFGEPNHHDWANCVKQTSDGGYILTGVTSSYDVGSAEVWLIKTNSTGIQIWNKTFGGLGSDLANSVEQTIDGGYILTGYTATNQDALLIKTDSNGNLEWEKTFGGTDIYQANSVQQTTEGGYILGGHIDSRGAGIDDAWLIKTDSNGDQQWNKTFGGAYDDRIDSIRQTLDGGYILAGWTNLKGSVQEYAWLIKTDSNGFQQWEMTFGMSNERGHSVQQTSDGGYILAGETWANGLVYSDAWLIKVSSESVNSGPVHNINKGTNYTTIQAAIDDASPGDEIHVDSGTYYENVVVNKQLTLRGIDTGDSLPVINAGEDIGIVIDADYVTIDGFNIINSDFTSIAIGGNNNNILNNDLQPRRYWGIGLFSNNSIVDNNRIICNQWDGNEANETGGIWIANGHFNNITNNSVSNGLWGISDASLTFGFGAPVSGSPVISVGNLIIFNNTISSSNIGIALFESNQNLIENNNISNNYENIAYEVTGTGVLLFGSNDSTIKDNLITENEKHGIALYHSYWNVLYENNVENNLFGVALEESNDNKFYHNNFDNTVNAVEDGSNNIWDDGYPSGGNFWNDYAGIDQYSGPNQDEPDYDGIGDTSHPIPEMTNGIVSSEDRYPLIAPYSPPPSDYEGKLLRQTGDLKVYLIEDSKKCHFTTPEALEWKGYRFDDVIEVSEDVINSFEPDSDISITQAIIDKYHALGGDTTFGPPAGTGEQSGDPDNAGVICTYVNFQNGAIEYFTNGDQAGNAYAILNPFFDKWASMGYAKSVLGYPISDMSDTQTSTFGTSFKYQNFMNGTESGALEHNLATGEVFEIHGAIFATWSAMGYADSILGLVTSDERDAVPSFKGTTGRVSDFENGHLHWHSSGDHYMVTYMTYGDLDELYVSMGGTASWLGFPVMHQEDRGGYGYCEFEGGYIEWDVASGAYKAKNFGITDGLVAEWHFDEGSGNVLGDSSGNGNDGTIYGATWTTNGKFASALQFDGNDYIVIPDSPELSGGAGKNMTVEYWFNTNNQGAYIISKIRDVSYKDWSALIGGFGPGLNFWYENRGYDRRFYSGSAIEEGVWHHGAFTFQRSTSGSNAVLKMYLDGNELPLTPFYQDGVPSNQLYDMPDTSAPVSIGYAGTYYGNLYFNGKIDEIRVFDRVLTAEDIKSEFDRGGADITPPTIMIDTPNDGAVINQQKVIVSGVAFDDSGIYLVTVNGIIAAENSGLWSAEIPLSEGENKIEIIAVDNYLNQAVETILVTYQPFKVQIKFPAKNRVYPKDREIRFEAEVTGGEPKYNFMWIIDDPKIVEPIHTIDNNIDSWTLSSLEPGYYNVKLVVNDKNGLRAVTETISFSVKTRIVYIPIRFSGGSKPETKDLEDYANKVLEFYEKQSYKNEIMESTYFSEVQLSNTISHYEQFGLRRDAERDGFHSHVYNDTINTLGRNSVKNFNTVVLIKSENDIIAIGGTSDKWDLTKDGIGKALVDDGGDYCHPWPNCEANSFGQWAHEIGHASFGFNHNNSKYWSVMELGMKPIKPIMSYDKVTAGWIDYEPILINDEKVIKLIHNLEPPEDKIYKYDLAPNGIGPLPKAYIEWYVFEGREKKTFLHKDRILVTQKTKTWNKKESDWTDNYVNKALYADEDPYIDPVNNVKFNAVFENNNLKLKVSEFVPKSKILTNVDFRTDNFINGHSAEPIPEETMFDIDLHMFTDDSRRVGMDYSSGEFINEIDESEASGNAMGAGREWILIPDNIKGSAFVDITQAEKWAEENDKELLDIEVYWQVIHFDENGNHRESEIMTMSIDPENTDGPIILTFPINITFLPPITTMDQFNLTDGSTLPIKFTARNSTSDEFIYDNTVNVTITNSTGHLITYFTNGTGTDSVRINSTEEQYIVNFHTKDYDLNVGETYVITVTFGELDSLRGYDITYFTSMEGGKAKGKSN